MMIYKNSGNKGFAVGSNSISREALGGLGLSLLALLMMGVFSLIKPKPKKPIRKQENGKKKKVKKLLNLAVILPTAYKLGKGIVQKAAIDKLKSQFEEGVFNAADELGIPYDDGISPIEVEYAVPIGREEEVYEFIEENQV